ncbi:MAG: ATPase, T2SS/T4P/T4SS family [Acidaminobacteraceae bacterium]
MGVVKTYHNYILEEQDEINFNYETYGSSVINKVISVILTKNPSLVADVNSNKFSKDVLVNEIIRVIDDFGYMSSREKIIEMVLNHIFGYGILQKYIEDEEITDIDGTRYDFFTIKRNGEKIVSDIKFDCEEDFDRYCKLLVIRAGGIINENDSHCRVADENYKLRINVSIAPRNISGVSLNIRKHRQKSYDLDELLRENMLDEKSYKIITEMIVKNSRIIFCGKGAAGKTTLLRAYLNSLPTDNRILVCESDPEIYPENKNIIVQRIRKKNYGGKAVTLNDLMKDGLTMSLDGYCIGEIVGGEAWEFIKAGYTDHSIYGTIHSIGAKDTINRLLMLMEENLNSYKEETLKEIISRSIDYIVYLRNFQVAEICIINGFDEEKKCVIIEELYNKKLAN